MIRPVFILPFIFLLCCVLNNIQAQDTIIRYKKPIIPDYINFQYAGNVGAYVVGAGYFLNSRKTLEFVFSYGYSSKHHAAKPIHNLAVKVIYIPVTWEMQKNWFLSAKSGIGLSRQFQKGSNTYSRLPNTYPDDYYAPNAYRIHFSLGGKIRKEIGDKTFIKAIDLYIETTTNDLYLTYLFKSNEVHIPEVFSMAIGMNLVLFDR